MIVQQLSSLGGGIHSPSALVNNCGRVVYFGKKSTCYLVILNVILYSYIHTMYVNIAIFTDGGLATLTLNQSFWALLETGFARE